MSRIYADYAAATPINPKVKKVMIAAMDEYANPSSIHSSGHAVELKIKDLTKKTASLLGVKTSGIIFTSGSTEANNLALKGFDGRSLCLSTDHKSSIDIVDGLIEVDSKGIIDFGDLNSKLSSDVSVISLAYVNNETGVVQPIKDISKIIGDFNDENDCHVKLHLDASQAQLLSINLPKLGADMMTISAGKIYGPKAAGILAFNIQSVPRPQIIGGGQQGGLRGGTESLVQISGTVKALDISRGNYQNRAKQLQKTRSQAIELLDQSGLDFEVVGGKHVSNHILQLIFPGFEAERLVLEMDARGVEASSGAACSASDDSPSHVLIAMGRDTISARSGLRLSFSHLTTADEIQAITAAVVASVTNIKDNQF